MRRKRRGRRRRGRRRRGRRRRGRSTSLAPRALYEIDAVDARRPSHPPSWKRMLLPLPMTTHGRRSRARGGGRRRAPRACVPRRGTARDRRRRACSGPRGTRPPPGGRPRPRRGGSRARAPRGSSRRAAGSPSSTGAPRRSRANAAATWADDARSAARSGAIRAKGWGGSARARASPRSSIVGGTPPRLPSARVPGPRRIADGDETARRETGSIARLHEGGPAASLDADAIASRGRVCARPAAERRVFCQQRRLTSRDSIES